jgi:choline dehydrogenase-like flavoprotein
MSIVFYYPLLAHPGLLPGISISYAASLARHSKFALSRSSRQPNCNPKFFSTHKDRFIMRAAIRNNIRLTSTSPLADQLEGEVAPSGFKTLTLKSTDEDIDERTRAFAMTVAHPMVVCALGPVLDDESRVKGAEGLRVCDASFFLEPTGAMPSFTVLALGEMYAELFAGLI